MAPALENLRGLVKRPPAIGNLKGIVKRAPSLENLRGMVKRPQAFDNIGEFVKRAFEKGEASRFEAHRRLQLVLLQDRSSLTAESLEALKNDLLVVMAKYVIIERDCLEIDIKQSGESLLLIANVRVFNDGEAVENPQPLLSPKKTAALKNSLLETAANYLPVDSDSIEVEEQHFNDSVVLVSSIRIADGESFPERKERTVSLAAS
ncbi:MAG: cell division topological specificity factor MinE [Candidatus Binatia bacterium]